jgi:hypothetical protein
MVLSFSIFRYLPCSEGEREIKYKFNPYCLFKVFLISAIESLKGFIRTASKQKFQGPGACTIKLISAVIYGFLL